MVTMYRNVAMNISVNPSYIEDFNGSDYVCMKGSTSAQQVRTPAPQINYAQKAVNIATSSPTSIGSPKHISAITTAVTAPQQPTQTEHVSTSPTPSQISSESGSGKRK